MFICIAFIISGCYGDIKFPALADQRFLFIVSTSPYPTTHGCLIFVGLLCTVGLCMLSLFTSHIVMSATNKQ